AEAVSLAPEVEPQPLAERLHRDGQVHRLAERAPLLAGQSDDHHTLAVGAGEVATEGSEEFVALPLARLSELRFSEEAEMPHHRQRDVFERQLDVLAPPGVAPAPLASQQSYGHHLPGDQIPRRQDVVD